MDEEETARYRRFLVAPAAHTFLAARILIRSLLTHYYGHDPLQWRFQANPWGRPELASPAVAPRLQFNLSHKPGMVVCLIGQAPELGVDVEDAAISRHYLMEIAGRFFSRAEAAALRALPEDQRQQRFYEYWTLKESYIKARGRGLSLGLSGFSFQVPSSGPPSVSFDPEVGDSPLKWSFSLMRPTGTYLVAASVRTQENEQVAINVLQADTVVHRTLTDG